MWSLLALALAASNTADLQNLKGDTIGTAQVSESHSGARLKLSAVGLSPGLYELRLVEARDCANISEAKLDEPITRTDFEVPESGQVKATLKLKESARAGLSQAIVLYEKSRPTKREPASQAAVRVACGVVR